MKYKLVLILCMVVLMSSFASAIITELCYQEFANVSTACGGLGTGNYSIDSWGGNGWKLADGDFGTIAAGNHQNFTVNYTKPFNALNSSLLLFKGFPIINLTIPQICFNQEPLQFKINTLGSVNVHVNCHNGTDFQEFYVDIGDDFFAEEAMWWNLTAITNLSLTFIDEVTNTLIVGETFNVFIEKSNFSRTASATTNPFTIADINADFYTKLKVSSTNYPERQYLNIDLRDGRRNTPVNFTVYLINNTLGSEVTFNIVSVDGLAPLENVRVVFTKSINGTDTVIAEEDSDFAGQVVLTLNPDTQYTINFSRIGFQDRTILLEPKNADYLIQMVSTVGAYNQSVHEGIRYRFEPVNTVLNNNTKFNFTFTLNSTVWPLTNCTLKLFNGTILLSQSSSFTSTSCFISIEQNTFNMTSIIAEGIYELDSQFEFTATQNYKVIFTYIGQFSLKNFLDDLSDFGMAGFDDFGRMILTLIVIFIITALAAQQVGFENREVLILIVIAQVWFFSSVNWLFLDFTPIPTIAGFDLKKYIIAILVTMAGGAFVIEKFTKQ